MLPPELQRAQAALAQPEVQDILRQLAKWNLGVFMPHYHDEDTGEFLPPQKGLVQLEQDLRVTFVREDTLADITAIPTAWIWSDEGPVAAASCYSYCQTVTIQSGGEYHSSSHLQRDNDDDDDD